MKPQVSRYAWSFAVAFAVTGLVSAISGLPRCFAVGVLLAPGMLAAAIVFPEGIHSNWGSAYLVLAALMNGFFAGLAGIMVLELVEHFRRRY